MSTSESHDYDHFVRERKTHFLAVDEHLVE